MMQMRMRHSWAEPCVSMRTWMQHATATSRQQALAVHELCMSCDNLHPWVICLSVWSSLEGVMCVTYSNILHTHMHRITCQALSAMSLAMSKRLVLEASYTAGRAPGPLKNTTEGALCTPSFPCQKIRSCSCAFMPDSYDIDDDRRSLHMVMHAANSTARHIQETGQTLMTA